MTSTQTTSHLATGSAHVAAMREADETFDLETFETLVSFATCAEMAEFYGDGGQALTAPAGALAGAGAGR
jgi:hypothetical protein